MREFFFLATFGVIKELGWSGLVMIWISFW